MTRDAFYRGDCRSGLCNLKMKPVKCHVPICMVPNASVDALFSDRKLCEELGGCSRLSADLEFSKLHDRSPLNPPFMADKRVGPLNGQNRSATNYPTLTGYSSPSHVRRLFHPVGQVLHQAVHVSFRRHRLCIGPVHGVRKNGRKLAEEVEPCWR